MSWQRSPAADRPRGRPRRDGSGLSRSCCSASKAGCGAAPAAARFGRRTPMRRSDEFAAVLARVVPRLRTRDTLRALAVAGLVTAPVLALARDGLCALVAAIAIAAVMAVLLPARGISSVASPHSAAAASTAPTLIVD